MFQHDPADPILLICDSCGAAVVPSVRQTHERWHKGIARDITRAGRTADPKNIVGYFNSGGVLPPGHSSPITGPGK